ncbi:MAG: hypothetical protein ACYTHM_17125 [Planctomycetota bacterium]|jgi:hypothetical protein
MPEDSPDKPTDPIPEPGAERQEGRARIRLPFGRRPLWVYLTTAFSLIGLHFLTRSHLWPGALDFLRTVFFGEGWLADLAFWALGSCFFYMVPSTLVAWFVLRKSPLDLGLRLGNLLPHIWVYGLLLLGVLPLLYLSSLRADFQWTYPFSPRVGESLRFFVAWEILYILQFLALEYFFRGFLLFPLEEDLGPNAVLVMIVPYAMVHFQKPFLMDALALSRHGTWPPGA